MQTQRAGFGRSGGRRRWDELKSRTDTVVACKMDGQWEVAARVQGAQPGRCGSLAGRDAAGPGWLRGRGCVSLVAESHCRMADANNSVRKTMLQLKCFKN